MLVSIITPTFNRRELLGHAIASVLKQTWHEFEMIIVDDGSSDGTREMVQAIGDPRLRYEYQANAGQSSARNRGLALSRGELIAFLDSDNEWVNTRLERHTGLLQAHPDYDAIYGVSLRFNESQVYEPPKRLERPTGDITRALLSGNFIPFNSVLLRRSLAEKAGGFDESLRSAEDYDFWLRASLHGRFMPDSEISTRYRITPGSISHDLDRNFKANELILQRFLEENPEFAGLGQRSRTWSNFYAGTSGQWSGAKQHRHAIHDAARAVMAAPWRLIGYRAGAYGVLNAIRDWYKSN